MSDPRKKKTVNSTARRGHQLPARVEDDLWDALKAEAAAEDRKVAQMVAVLLKEALAARGRWSKPLPRRKDD